MQKPNKKKRFLSKPWYPGGKEAFELFIKKNLVYPEAALEAKEEATIPVKLLMNHKGKVIKATAQSHPGWGLHEEAERVCKLLRFQVDKNPGMRVTFNKTLKIHFKLPPPKPKKVEKKVMPKSISYTYTSVPQQTKPQTKSSSYTYQIKIQKK